MGGEHTYLWEMYQMSICKRQLSYRSAPAWRPTQGLARRPTFPEPASRPAPWAASAADLIATQDLVDRVSRTCRRAKRNLEGRQPESGPDGSSPHSWLGGSYATRGMAKGCTNLTSFPPSRKSTLRPSAWAPQDACTVTQQVFAGHASSSRAWN